MNTKTTPKDFFLHVGAVIALYASAIALVNLAFAIVNKIFPDALSGILTASSIVWPVSFLIVMAPILYVIEWVINRDIAKTPEKKENWVWKWRVYLTLFLTSLAMASDLVALINVYLNGEITERFVWKVVIVFISAALIFAYYILARVGAIVGPKRAYRVTLAWLSSVLIFAAIVGGFIIVGSPAQQRSFRFDEQRVTDLSDIQYQVLNYWQANGKLPAALINLNNHFTEYSAPTDPETYAQYEYSILPNATEDNQTEPAFELCAVFALPSSDEPDSEILPSAPYPMSEGSIATTWDHSSGRACFTRSIDPKLYPVSKVN
jgi:hypothetical protein